MNEPNKDIQGNKTLQNQEGVNTAKPTFSWRKLMAKKWAFPAMYMAVAAIILSLMWVYQDSDQKALTEDMTGLNTVEKTVSATVQPDVQAVNAAVEEMQWPVMKRNEVEVFRTFYDNSASSEIRQAAMIQFGNTFTPHVGIDLARQDDQPFEVVAALSGKVTHVDKDPLVGHVVEITHPNGLISIYQSLSDVSVVKGADIKKGDVFAKAGRNELEKEDGVHLHFEVRQGQDGSTVDPNTLLPHN